MAIMVGDTCDGNGGGGDGGGGGDAGTVAEMCSLGVCACLCVRRIFETHFGRNSKHQKHGGRLS